MNNAADMAETQSLLLGELAELSMSLARRLHERAMAAEATEDVQGLALAFQRTARSVRQTLALQARLDRDLRREASEAGRSGEQRRREAVAARKAHVGAVVSRLIWTEAESEDEDEEGGAVGALLAGLKRLLDEEAYFEDAFLQTPVEAQIARIRDDLGLAANDHAMEPAPPGEDPDETDAAGKPFERVYDSSA